MDDEKPTKCCGILLKHGTILIGVLESFFGFIGFIGFIGSVIGITASLPAYHTLFIFMAVVCASHLIFANLLIIGATSGYPALFFPWLTLRGISAIATAVLIYVAIFCMQDKLIVYLGLASAIIDLCLISVVHDYRKELLKIDTTTQTEESP